MEVANLAHTAKDGQTQVGLTGFLRGDTPDHFCAILECLCDMERRLWIFGLGPVSWRARLLDGS